MSEPSRRDRDGERGVPQWVHRFGVGMAAVGDLDPAVVGAKGAGLARASRAGLSVPPGFTLSTAACRAYHENGRTLPTEVSAAIGTAVRSIEAATGCRFGGRNGARPLALAVRPSPSTDRPVPGLMPTVQHLGARRDGGPRGVQAEASVLHALGADEGDLEEALAGADPAPALDALGIATPDGAFDRLDAVIRAGLDSWASPRARVFRTAVGTGSRNGSGGEGGLAIVVQAMVECVAPDIAIVGAARTRNAETGERGIRGFFAPGSSSISAADPSSVRRLASREADDGGADTLERTAPDLLTRIEAAGRVLERAERRPIDMKFAVGSTPRSHIWVLHASHAPLSAAAAIRVAVDMVGEGLIDERDAVSRIDPASLDQVLHARIGSREGATRIGTGLAAAPGAATGTLAFTTAAAIAARERGETAILACTETGPDDIAGIQAAGGVLTTRGGLTSHAAVVARGLGRACVTGASGIRVDARAGTLRAGGIELREGDPITLDGSSGDVLGGAAQLLLPEVSGHFATLMGWADNARRLRVRANADTATDAAVARDFGAEGIGLCRTEHMMVDPSRATPMREMILAETDAERQAALDRLLPLQRADFVRVFETMAGLPVMIRLLDPPLHEFLPKSGPEMARAAEALGVPVARMAERVEALRETNPMLGHRGCRLAISYPMIARMQVRAILEAAGEVAVRTGRGIDPEIMVPLVSMLDELDYVKRIVDEEARAVVARGGPRIRYRVGTMIELPRAALRADDIAHTAEFFSFGTNDLTQTTFGISRDDASPFLGRYREIGIMDADPFATIDRRGVGRLVRMACELGREVRPDIALSICGEHGGDPASIEFCEEIGLDYVSCSPYRVPVARLAAAQAAIRKAVRTK